MILDLFDKIQERIDCFINALFQTSFSNGLPSYEIISMVTGYLMTSISAFVSFHSSLY